MPIKKLTIQEFLEKAKHYPVLDVRSPGEYSHAQIPGAHSLPLFSDEERKIVGTTYKQQSREKAIKTGLDFFGVKMRQMVEEAEKIIRDKPVKNDSSNGTIQETSYNTKQVVLVHCWRGGMRSAGVAWLLDLYGFEVYTLIGGYKAFRNYVLQQFEKDYDIKIIGGYTGSGKTILLKQLQTKGQQVIDLEGLACHKGSAFGALGQAPQPTQEMFENLLAMELNKLSETDFWLEDESQRIGIVNIPHRFWETMRKKPVFFVDISFEKRLEYITKEYGQHEKEKLITAIIRIQKRLGPLETKTAIGFLVEDNYTECFKILLGYYDKLYNKALHNRKDINTLLNKIECINIDAVSNTNKILSCAIVNT